MFSASALYVAFCGVFETTNDIRDGAIRLIWKYVTALISYNVTPSRKALTDLLSYFVLEETTLAALALELPFNGQRVKLASHLRTMKGAERLGQRQRGLFRCACV
mmetsp:Transcript_20282/g.50182  ORF Transcript_20282/g.50182 Transcript_20282/m.50182 type:complete len:105 (-) Transcript_20282:10-324(-)